MGFSHPESTRETDSMWLERKEEKQKEDLSVPPTTWCCIDSSLMAHAEWRFNGESIIVVPEPWNMKSDLGHFYFGSIDRSHGHEPVSGHSQSVASQLSRIRFWRVCLPHKQIKKPCHLLTIKIDHDQTLFSVGEWVGGIKIKSKFGEFIIIIAGTLGRHESY